MIYRTSLAAIALIFSLCASALALDPQEILSDPALEQRARTIGKELRCLVCQNQSIDDSEADLAKDLRRVVREQIVTGKNDDEVVAYVVARYGDYVLLKPPFKPQTYVLWLGPLAIFALGLWGVFLFHRRRSGLTPPPPLSREEQDKSLWQGL